MKKITENIEIPLFFLFVVGFTLIGLTIKASIIGFFLCCPYAAMFAYRDFKEKFV